MNRTQKRRLEMFVRSRDFGKEHQALFPESTMGGQLFAALAAAVASIEQFLTNRVVARAEARKVKDSTKAAVYEYVKAIANTARRITAGESGPNPFRIPRRLPVTALISTARAFIAEATAREQEFVKRGLPASFLADFGKAVDELEKAATVQLNSRTERRMARTGIEATLEQGMDTIRELDVVVANALRLDPIRLGAWRAARRIDALNPPAKEQEDDPASSKTDTPLPTAAPDAAPGTEAAPKAS